MKRKISAIVSVFNEEKNLKDCLETLKWCDEIVVVNNSSTDKTEEIAKRYTDKVFKRENLKMLFGRLCKMVCIRLKKLKILNPIILNIAVFVMNHFTWSK